MLGAVELPPSQFPSTSPGVPPTPGVPFEGTGGFFARFTAQLGDITVRPIDAGRAMAGGDGTLGPALLFGAICSLLGYLPVLTCLPCVLVLVPALATSPNLPPGLAAMESGMLCGAVGGAPFFLVGSHLFVDLLFAVCFHGIAKAAGGRGTFGQSLRAALYTRGITAWLAVLWFVVVPLSCIPFLGTVVHFCTRAAMVVWTGLTLFGAAESVHGLPQDRAIMVTAGAVALAIAIAIGLGGLVAFAVVTLMAGGLVSLGALAPT